MKVTRKASAETASTILKKRSLGSYWWAVACLFVIAGCTYISMLQTTIEDATYPQSSSVPFRNIKLIAVGDLACDAEADAKLLLLPDQCKFSQTVDAIRKEKADYTLLLGDLQYNYGESSDYEKVFIRDWSGMPGFTYAVPGNHDYGTKDASPYYEALSNKIPNAYGGDPGKGYYSVSIRNWKIIALNTNCEYIGGCGNTSAQYDWLSSEVNNLPICSIAFWHHPTKTSSLHSEVESVSRGKDFNKLLASHFNDVVLNGHDHNYERFAPIDKNGAETSTNGMRTFIAGAGGRSLYKVSATHVNGSEFVDDSNFGYLVITLKKLGYEWQYKHIDGVIIDSGASSCG